VARYSLRRSVSVSPLPVIYASRCFQSIVSPFVFAVLLPLSMGEGRAEDKPKRRRWSRRNPRWESKFEYFDSTRAIDGQRLLRCEWDQDPLRGGKAGGIKDPVMNISDFPRASI